MKNAIEIKTIVEYCDLIKTSLDNLLLVNDALGVQAKKLQAGKTTEYGYKVFLKNLDGTLKGAEAKRFLASMKSTCQTLLVNVNKINAVVSKNSIKLITQQNLTSGLALSLIALYKYEIYTNVMRILLKDALQGQISKAQIPTADDFRLAAKISNDAVKKIGLANVDNIIKKLYKLGQNIEVFSKDGKLNPLIQKSLLGATTVGLLGDITNIFPSITLWLGELWVLRKHKLYIRQKATRDWLITKINLMKLEKSDLSFEERKRQQEIIDNYESQLAAVERDIKKYETA